MAIYRQQSSRTDEPQASRTLSGVSAVDWWARASHWRIPFPHHGKEYRRSKEHKGK
jgi:hypothetical protein